VNIDLLFGSRIFDGEYLAQLKRDEDWFGSIRGLANGNLFNEFVELWPTFPGTKNPHRISRTLFAVYIG